MNSRVIRGVVGLVCSTVGIEVYILFFCQRKKNYNKKAAHTCRSTMYWAPDMKMTQYDVNMNITLTYHPPPPQMCATVKEAIPR